MSLHLENPAIYLITKGEARPSNFADKRREICEIIRVAVEEKVALIQLREKRLPARLLFELACEAAAITRRSATRLLVNDRADIALVARADGVHLTASSLPTDVIRNNFPTDFIVGVSTHTLEAAQIAVENGADLVFFGPIFETPGKGQPQGTAKLAEVCEKLRPFPVIAIGGLDETNFRSVLEAGAVGFAAIRALNDPESLHSICKLVASS